MPHANARRARSSDAPQPEESTTNKPVERFHDGPVHVSIWEKAGPKGQFRTASFQLRYREGDDWRTSQSYGLSDLAHLERAAHRARDSIEHWQQTAKTKPSHEPRF